MLDISYLGDLNGDERRLFVRPKDSASFSRLEQEKQRLLQSSLSIKVNVRSHNILAVTFTNKAANEMKFRIEEHIGDLSEGLKWIGTFHLYA